MLRLRGTPACNHPSLVSKDFCNDKDAAEPKAAQDDEDDTEDLAAAFGQLGMSGSKKCRLCQTASVIPLQPLTFSSLVYHSLPAGDDSTYCKECKPLARATEPTSKSSLPAVSAKIKKILDLLKMIGERSEGVEKTIVFSQFTTMLDLIEPFLDAHGIKHVRCSSLRPTVS